MLQLKDNQGTVDEICNLYTHTFQYEGASLDGDLGKLQMNIRKVLSKFKQVLFDISHSKNLYTIR